uniref:Uncharacterized protein n=1 Tax=Mola mola TaxID=94237 RepID=A0A3Q3VM19_MOLML
CWPGRWGGGRGALMTSPSADRDLLMHCASLRRLPSAPDLAILSEPARSTRFSFPAAGTQRDEFMVQPSIITRQDRLTPETSSHPRVTVSPPSHRLTPETSSHPRNNVSPPSHCLTPETSSHQSHRLTLVDR